MEHTESVEVKWAGVAQPCNRKRNGKRPVIRTSEAGLFQKCPSVDTHSGVTLQQTYYLLFCHFGFSTTNLGQDSISAPDMSASLTITQALSLSLSLTLAEWVCPLREKMVLLKASVLPLIRNWPANRNTCSQSG